MKKLLIVAIVLIPCFTKAQEYKVAQNTGRLEIQLGKVIVEGYSGNEIIFTSMYENTSKDTRAEGLRAINGLGIEDNTGLGVNVTRNANTVIVKQLKKVEAPEIKIKVPKGVIVSFQYESQYGGVVKLRNMENEIEVSARYNSIEMENVTGPMIVKTIYGHVEAKFANSIKSPVSVVSVYGYVDVSLPVETRANLRLSSSYGEILVSPDLKLEVNREGMDNNSGRIQGKLGGGGDLNMDLSSNYGKIYLRKKN
ncbi:MAG TPA: hypothetical protein DIS90_14500 [Cytophagales bacterium]|nr:hypothetical protein [Cytophagales bacterium]HCR54976.1 hypothetical protein [Cytophagales bacterium]